MAQRGADNDVALRDHFSGRSRPAHALALAPLVGRNRWTELTVAGAELTELAADQPDALDLLQRREASAVLYRILDGIGEKYRTVIILFELEGKSGEEIAALTETSLSNVWVRLYRAREKVLKRFSAWEAKEEMSPNQRQIARARLRPCAGYRGQRAARRLKIASRH